VAAHHCADRVGTDLVHGVDYYIFQFHNFFAGRPAVVGLFAVVTNTNRLPNYLLIVN
jgi:beta-xylosidase